LIFKRISKKDDCEEEMNVGGASASFINENKENVKEAFSFIKIKKKKYYLSGEENCLI
jgi:hypothetical protein